MVKKIIIIGAGVIGSAAALTLQQDGHQVTLIDRQAPCSGASFGNAGGIINGSCIPTAMPGIFFDALKMLSKPLSPLSIRASYLIKIMPWLWHFVWQSRTSNVTNNATHLYALSQNAVSSWKQLTDNTLLSKYLEESGWLNVYETDAGFAGMKDARRLMEQLGCQYERLNADQIRQLEPNLAPIFKHGIFQKNSLSINNPHALVTAMVDLFIARGGRFQPFAVDEISVTEKQVQLTAINTSLQADQVIVATGAWSKILAKHLGDSVPLECERGYHMMFRKTAGSVLNRPVVNGENSFVLCPMSTGIRMTSQVEFAGLNAAPNYNRIRNLLPAVKRMLPQVDTHEESIWMGHRPSLPDSLPVIGRSTVSNRVVYAFGHQHLGMTLAAITAYIVSDIISDRQPRVAITPFRPNRFKLL